MGLLTFLIKYAIVAMHAWKHSPDEINTLTNLHFNLTDSLISYADYLIYVFLISDNRNGI